MTSEAKRRDLSHYRITQARETLEEAEFLLSGRKSPRSIINRTYYAMFYAILALLVYEPYSSSKHSGVISYFNRRFIKSGLFPEDLGRLLNKAFELRQRSDYREYADLTYEQVEPLVSKEHTFIRTIEEYLSRRWNENKTP